MSERSKRILALALKGQGSQYGTKTQYDITEDESFVSSSLDAYCGFDGEDESFVSSSSDAYCGFDGIENYSIDTHSEPTNMYDKDVRQHTNSVENYFTSEIKFEFENDFGEVCWFTDNVLKRLKDVYDISSPSICQSNSLLRRSKCTSTTSELVLINSNGKNQSKGYNIPDLPFLTKDKYKMTRCKFCDAEIVSKHFARHLGRIHKDERDVKAFLYLDPKSRERKRLLSIIRNDGNLELSLRGYVIPKKRVIGQKIEASDYAICMYCKAFYKRLALSRHIKKCPFNMNNAIKRPLTESIIYSSCKKKYGDVSNKLLVRQEIFGKMLGDAVTSVALDDILIVLFGEDLIKKNKNKRSSHHINNKLRECAKFVIEIRKLGGYDDLLSALKPECFDDVIEAAKVMSRYDVQNKTFGAPSLALHFGTTLKKLVETADKHVLMKRISVSDIEKTIQNLARFKMLVETQWATELGSLALKDLNEKSAVKPKLLPITEDIIKLNAFVQQKCEEAYGQLKIRISVANYKILVETALVLTIIHNRKRVGDIQYLELKSYTEQIDRQNTAQGEMIASLTENEKLLTQHYKRIVAIGKGSRPVTILIPRKIQKHFAMIEKLRISMTWFCPENRYFFTYPSSSRWIDGCAIIRKYAHLCEAKYPHLLTSCRLRKHIATVTQVLNLKENEIDQLAKFMGHTSKTHESFYKLPQDVYQIAKVSKILQIMEMGNAHKFKNKSIEEIEIDMEEILEDGEETEFSNSEGLSTDTRDEMLDGRKRTKLVDAREEVLDDRNETTEVIDTTHDILGDEEETEIMDTTGKEDALDELNRETETKRRGGRQRWKAEQKPLMLQHFQTHIRQKRAPKKRECLHFKNLFKKEFEEVNWVRIKTYIYNEYR